MNAKYSVHRFDAEVERFAKQKDVKRLLVALSGGVDSVSLLHKLASLTKRYDLSLTALHADHQIQSESGEWVRRCQAQCEEIRVSLITVKLNLQNSHYGKEAAARQARYDWFLSQMKKGDILVTAHHMEDQVETVLLRLFRGSGVLGLGAMHEIRQFGVGRMARPLLQVPKDAIVAYANSNNLSYINDPSNLDTDIDRNFVRHQVLPLIRSRWPGVDGTIYRGSEHFKTIQANLDRGAQIDLNMYLTVSRTTLLGDYGCIKIDDLISFEDGRIIELLRYWIRIKGLMLPTTATMNELIRQVFRNGACGRGGIRWSEGEFRVYRKFLYLLPVQPQMCNPVAQYWRELDPVRIDEVDVVLSARHSKGCGIKLSWLKNSQLRLDWHHKDSVIKPTNSDQKRTIKNLFQERGIPPWERRRLPYVYLDEKLVCIPGLAVEKAYSALNAEIGLEINISGTQIAPLDQ